jgi:hypothetical protein
MVWERRPGDRSVDRAPGATEPSVEFATEPEPGPA